MNAQILSEPKVANFIATLDENVRVDEIKCLAAQYKKNGELLFGTFEVSSPDVLPYIFIRGDAVAVVPIIRVKDDKHGRAEKYYLCVEQRRVADGKIHCEFPAGMMDRDGDPLAVVVKELEEETGLSVEKNSLTALNGGKPLFTSPGASDEKIYFFKADIELSPDKFAQLQNKIIENDDEKILVKLYSEEEFEPKISSCITKTAYDLSKICET